MTADNLAESAAAPRRHDPDPAAGRYSPFRRRPAMTAQLLSWRVPPFPSVSPEQNSHAAAAATMSATTAPTLRSSGSLPS